jgi:hypothetical protein
MSLIPKTIYHIGKRRKFLKNKEVIQQKAFSPLKGEEDTVSQIEVLRLRIRESLILFFLLNENCLSGEKARL